MRQNRPLLSGGTCDTRVAVPCTESINTYIHLCNAGLCASIDPERDGVKEAVLQSKTAGVRVVMITGDYLKTAIAIAKNINILNRRTFVEGNGACVGSCVCVCVCVFA